MPMPDNQIDYSFFGPGAKRRQRDADVKSRHHAKQSSKLIRHRERLKTDSDDDETMRTEPRTTRSRIAMLALKYETLDEAYANHEDEIGSRISRLTIANIFGEARRTFKEFRRLGFIDEDALARYLRRK